MCWAMIWTRPLLGRVPYQDGTVVTLKDSPTVGRNGGGTFRNMWLGVGGRKSAMAIPASVGLCVRLCRVLETNARFDREVRQ